MMSRRSDPSSLSARAARPVPIDPGWSVWTRLRDHGRRRGSARRSREAVRRLHGGRGHQPRHAVGRVLLAARAVRVRQDHHAADDRRVRAPERRPDPARRRRHGADPAAQAQREYRVPELRALPAPHGRGERRVRSEVQGRLEAGSARTGRPLARAGRAHRLRAAPPDAALRRPAAARRAGPGADPEPRGAPARRTLGRARREAPQATADRAEGSAGRGRHHVRLRDARPGRGPHDVGPHRGDEPGPRGADRPAEGDLRGAGDRLRRRLPGRLEPDGGERSRSGGRWLPGEARGVRPRRRPGRGGHPRPGEDHDPPRARRPPGAGNERREPRAGHGGTGDLRRLDPAGDREPRAGPTHPGVGAERGWRPAVRVGSRRSPPISRARRCGCCPRPARR